MFRNTSVRQFIYLLIAVAYFTACIGIVIDETAGLAGRKDGLTVSAQESSSTSPSSANETGDNTEANMETTETVEAVSIQANVAPVIVDRTTITTMTLPSSDGTFERRPVEELYAGTILDPSIVDGIEENYFKIYEITEGDSVYERINGKSFRPNNSITISDLRYMKILHYNYAHQIQVGEIVCNKDIAQDLLDVFWDLYRIEYEIQSVILVDEFWTGDPNDTDWASVDANNSSCFNYRTVNHSSNMSNHAWGRAIDINPQMNPYVIYSEGRATYTHDNASDYIDRSTGYSHMISRGDACYNIFIEHGFSWGGSWNNPDYQHFEK